MEKTVKEYIESNIDKWVKEEVLDEVIRSCQSANLPSELIGNIKIDGKYPSIKIISDWVGISEYDGSEVPLAVFFEFGTKDHFIKPKKVSALRWIDPFSGKTIFDKKGHMVSGLLKGPNIKNRGLGAIQKGIELGMPRLEKRINRESQNYISVSS